MHVCTYASCVAGSVLLLGSAFTGCRANSGEAQAPATAPAEAPAVTGNAASSANVPEDSTNVSSAEEPGAEKWEGEAQAMTDAKPSKAANPETRTTESIQKTIRDNRQPFRDCYDKARKELPSLRGTMTLRFVLDPEGKVKQAELNQDRSDIKSPTAVDCALAVLKKLEFPESSSGMDTTVNYPFDFKP